MILYIYDNKGELIQVKKVKNLYEYENGYSFYINKSKYFYQAFESMKALVKVDKKYETEENKIVILLMNN